MFMRISAAAFSAVLCATAAHAAGDCPLKQVASLDMVSEPGGLLAVPVKFGDDTKKLIVALGSAFPEMIDSYATHFASIAVPQRFVGLKLPKGDPVGVARIVRMEIGDAIVSNTRMLRVEHIDFGDPDVVGTLTLSLVRDFDLEVDFKHNKLNLFSQSHCSRPGAYWAKDYASLHFDSDQDGHITFPMSLDGKDVTVGIVTEPGHASMSMGAAYRLFGLTPDSPGMVAEKDVAAHYAYPFKALSAGSFVFTDPDISIVGDDPHKECRKAPPPQESAARFPEFAGINCYGGSDVTLGLSELRQLHLYFSLGDDVLYFTNADSHA
jgi:hypothetical protein